MQSSRTDLSVNVTVDGLTELAAIHGEASARLANTFMRRAIESEIGPLDHYELLHDGTYAIEMASATPDEAEEFLDRVRCMFDIQMFDAGFEIEVELSLASDGHRETFAAIHSSDFAFYMN